MPQTASKMVCTNSNHKFLNKLLVFPSLDQIKELVEQIIRIVWTWTCFWVILYREYILVLHFYSCYGLIVQMGVGNFQLGISFCFFPIHRESVVLRGNFSFPSNQV